MKRFLLFICALCTVSLAKADNLTATTTPSAPAGSTGTINLTVTGGAAPYTYSWSGPGGYSAATQDLTGLAAGTYTVTVGDKYCGTATLTVIVPAIPVGIATTNKENGISIFPNPTTKACTIETATALKQATLRVTDAGGRLVFSAQGLAGKAFPLDMSSYAPGIYFAEISEGGNSWAGKVVKE